jgi:hypothetical protein
MRPVLGHYGAGSTKSGIIYGRDAQNGFLFATIRARM